MLQSFRLDLGRTCLARLGLLDQRADDVRLPTCVEVLAEPRVRLPHAILGHPGGLDQLAIRRGLGDLGHGQVAVDRERERTGDRRRGHVQDVRRASLRQRLALFHAEAVLFVDHGYGEIAQLHTLLDERVGADDDVSRRSEVPLALGG